MLFSMKTKRNLIQLCLLAAVWLLTATAPAQSVLTTLAAFGGVNGYGPHGRLTLGADGSFYGTTAGGGSYGMGNVFRVTTNGVLTSIASFNYTNGANPRAGLTLGTDGSFYGTTFDGIANNSSYGTIFRVCLLYTSDAADE